MTISLIAAMDRNRNIGFEGDMPWGRDMPSDLAYFKETTLDNIIIMGRKTFESLPGVLPNRTHFVLSRQDLNYHDHDVKIVDSVERMIHYIRSMEQMVERENLQLSTDYFVIGGAEIYEQFLPHADKIYLTKVNASLPGDTKFPVITGKWKITPDDMIQRKGDKYASQRLIFERKPF